MSAQLKGVVAVSVAGAAVVTANGNGSAVDLKSYDGDIKLILSASATGGAGQTLDVKIQHSNDGTTWADSGTAFATVTNAAASYQVINATAEKFHRYIRAVDTVGGSTPTVARSVVLVARNR